MADFNSLQELRQYLAVSFQKLSKTDKLLLQIGSQTFADTRKRIFDDGIDSFGGKIIDGYSTKPFYVPVKASSKIRAKGKDGKGKFKSEQTKKSRYLPDGYKELKELVGREKPLELTGQFLSDYKFGLRKDEVVLGFGDTPRKTFASGLKKSAKITNPKLRKSLEKRFGVFTALTEQEAKQANDFIDKHINDSFK